WCAEHAYPYLGLVTALGPTCDLWDFYADIAADHGYQAGSENFGYLMGVFCADTDEKAQELGKGFIFGGGANAFSRVEHTLPPGYNSKAAIRRLGMQSGGGWVGLSAERLKLASHGDQPAPKKKKSEVTDYNEVRQKLVSSYEKAQRDYQMIVGSPKTVTEKIKTIMQVLRPGIFTVFQVQGSVSNEDRQHSMKLIAQEVMPAMREHAKTLGLADPFERFPGSVKLQPGTKRVEVVDRTPLQALKLAKPAA
ncbi:MAG: hypothetical protein ACRERD_31075, partial [Candidatus Binatia bacterium]